MDFIYIQWRHFIIFIQGVRTFKQANFNISPGIIIHIN